MIRITDHTADGGFEQEATLLENLCEEARPALGATHGPGIGRKVARPRPLIVVKG